ncbi:MAG: hypothetical protein KDB22_05675 [Planctomycetales bacterium]|nr:hypothetical protein [Planctomycetales bacterium]
MHQITRVIQSALADEARRRALIESSNLRFAKLRRLAKADLDAHLGELDGKLQHAAQARQAVAALQQELGLS